MSIFIKLVTDFSIDRSMQDPTGCSFAWKISNLYMLRLMFNSNISLCLVNFYNGMDFFKLTQRNCFRELKLKLPYEALGSNIMVHQCSEFSSIGYMDFASGINLITPLCIKQNWFESLRYKRKWKNYWVISAMKFWMIRYFKPITQVRTLFSSQLGL